MRRALQRQALRCPPAGLRLCSGAAQPGPCPDTQTAGALRDVFRSSAGGDADHRRSLQMARQRLHVARDDAGVPLPKSYSVVIVAACIAGDSELAQHYAAEAQAQGHTPLDDECYAALLELPHYRAQGSLQFVEEVLQPHGVAADALSPLLLRRLLEVASLQRDADAVLLFHGMMQHSGEATHADTGFALRGLVSAHAAQWLDTTRGELGEGEAHPTLAPDQFRQVARLALVAMRGGHTLRADTDLALLLQCCVRVLACGAAHPLHQSAFRLASEVALYTRDFLRQEAELLKVQHLLTDAFTAAGTPHLARQLFPDSLHDAASA